MTFTFSSRGERPHVSCVAALCFCLLVLVGGAQPFAQDITVVGTTSDLSAQDAAGWAGITAVPFQTSGNPVGGGHGSIGAGNLPEVNVQAAYDGTQIFLRFQWADASNDQGRLYTYEGVTSPTGWTSSGNEDRLYVAFPIADGVGREGLTFADIGCAALCHEKIAGAIVPDTASVMSDCGVCHANATGANGDLFTHMTVSAGSDCAGCHGGQDRTPPNGGDMMAPTGTAYDLWHWKAQRSNPIGRAEDQHTNAASGGHAKDGANLAPNNWLTTPSLPQYVGASGTSTTARTAPIFRSQIADELASGTLAEWNVGNGRYELGDGTSVTLVDGTVVNRHILEDLLTDDPSAQVAASGANDGANWTVVLSRNLSSAMSQTATDTDYAFDTAGTNSMAFAVTDNSGINHKGVNLVTLAFEQMGEGAPTLGTVTDNGDGTVTATWSNAGVSEPALISGLVYDLYADDWALAPDGSIWFNFSSNLTSGDFDLGLTGGYALWVGNLYANGNWYPSTNPQAFALYLGAPPHAALGLSVTAGAGSVATVAWTPDLYGTFACWLVVYSEGGGFVNSQGPQGDSLWHYAVWGTADYGSVDLTPPAAGDWGFYVVPMGWDATTLGNPALVFQTIP